jgi:surface carbohydrate biosynthesis protein (TIGR04326 family)
LIIWDNEGVASFDDETLLLWNSCCESASPKTISIPSLVEDRAEVLRQRYLAWIYDLGETRIRGRSLTEHLELRPGFSYWWMTLLAEKCNYSKSPQIDTAVKMMAFDEWAERQPICRIRLVSANAALVECFRLWCAKYEVKFEWQPGSQIENRSTWFRRIHNALVPWMQACIWLFRNTIDRWPLRGVGVQKWQASSAKVTFVSYLFNLVPEALAETRYESRYWGSLPQILHREGCKTNWLHLYVKDGLLPTARIAADTLRAFNETEREGQVHVALDSFICGRVLAKTLRDWLKIFRISKKLENQISQTASQKLALWPLFADDWRQSMSGRTAMANILHLNLFESAMALSPKQHVGVYIQENQGWEFGFIQAWRAAEGEDLIGSPHSTIRYWDLRYYYDRRSYIQGGRIDLPMPDKVAVNGPAARRAYLSGGYPVMSLVEVEALRYLYLAGFPTKSSNTPKKDRGQLRILVFGDYLANNTKIQMSLLEQANRFLPAGCGITVKSHPACPIEPADYPMLKIALTTKYVGELLKECDVAYTSAVTSAAVDAYCAGVPVVSLLDPKTLNQSPLRGEVGVQFVSTAEELANALTMGAARLFAFKSEQSFFFVDTALPRWKQLLLERSEKALV